jgi:hypothetical protein
MIDFHKFRWKNYANLTVLFINTARGVLGYKRRLSIRYILLKSVNKIFSLNIIFQ